MQIDLDAAMGNSTLAADLPASKDRQLSTSTQCRDNGSTSRKSHGSGIDGLPVQSSAMNLPSWLNNASTSKPSFSQDTPSTGKVGSINVGRKSWKRCLTHVYISRLIKQRGRLLKQGSFTHSYPFCWRSETSLIYRAVPSWLGLWRIPEIARFMEY